MMMVRLSVRLRLRMGLIMTDEQVRALVLVEKVKLTLNLKKEK